MAVQRVKEDVCIGCGQCVKSCPADVFRMLPETRKAVVRYPEDCRLCLWCVSKCPVDAIELINDITGHATCWG